MFCYIQLCPNYSSVHSDLVRDLLEQDWSRHDIMKYCSYLDNRKRINQRGRSAYQDSEKSKVYSAENLFLRNFRASGNSVKNFADYNEAGKYMKKVLASKKWSKLSKRSNIQLIEKRKVVNSRTAGMSCGYKIQLCPNYGMNEYVLLHEMAHSAGHMHHDVSFRQCLVELVSRFMGAAAGKMLKDAFKEKGLKMYRHKAIMSPQQWLISYNRINKARLGLAA